MLAGARTIVPLEWTHAPARRAVLRVLTPERVPVVTAHSAARSAAWLPVGGFALAGAARGAQSLCGPAKVVAAIGVRVLARTWQRAAGAAPAWHVGIEERVADVGRCVASNGAA